MTKARTEGTQNQKRTASSLSWPVLLVLGVGLLLLVSGIWRALGRAPGPPANFIPQAEGPRLAVDRELIDLGLQPYGRRVSAVFRVKNVGGETLRILEEPPVELVEGC